MDALRIAQYRDDGGRKESMEYDTVHGGKVQVRKGSTFGNRSGASDSATIVEPGTELYSAQQADWGQVMAIERDIAGLQAQLGEVVRHHPQTGEPVYRYQGSAREAIQKRLHFLSEVEAPYVRQQVAEARAWRAANVPTEADKHASALQRRADVKARADEIALEQEAQAEALRMAKAAKSR